MRTIRKALSFDDVLLEPSYSTVHPSKVRVSTRVAHKSLGLPIFSAAMDTITGYDMAVALGEAGGCGILHKNMPIEDQAAIAAKLSHHKISTTNIFYWGAAVGVGEMERLLAIYKHNPDFIVIDSAHGDTRAMEEFFQEIILKLSFMFDPYTFIVGNVSTASAAHRLYNAGVRVIKLGQGSGSICSTRVVAGIGVPQFQAILDVAEIREKLNLDFHIISDGGLRYSGDIVKALAAGADAVMLGGMLAGTDEALGGENYRGMGSIPAMEAGSASRYSQEGAKKLTPEGVEGKVKRKGPVLDVLKQIEGGLRAGLGYTGSHNLAELREASFVEITNSGLKESHPHSLVSIKSAPNYQV